MGKRKRGGTRGYNREANQNELSSSSLNAVPCSSGTELLSGELVDASDVKPLSPGMDVTDSTLKLLHMHTSLENQHNDLGRSLLLKRSRHHYGNHYSRRNSGSHARASTTHRRTALLSDPGVCASSSTSHGRRDSGNNSASTSLRRTVLSSDPGVHASASTSHGRTSLLHDSGNDASTSTFLGRTALLRGKGNHASASTSLGRPAFPAFLRDNFLKLIGQSGSHSRRHTGDKQDNREMQFRRPESVRFSTVIPRSASTDVVAKMVCGICDKLLRRKRYFPGDTSPSSTEFSVVAVLACGHFYHADCLEERTSVQEIQDPPCPQCMGCSLLSMMPQ